MVQAGTPQFHSCGLAVQGVRGAQEDPEAHPFHLVLAKTGLEILGPLFLLFLQGSQEHQAALVLGSLEGLAGLVILGNPWDLALLSTLESLGSPALLFLPMVLCQ